ncbi:MAG: hypothetical protein U9R19_16890, partial [Bacteroidota bacterium]|nr:hypothetical protein [Bacteroidota bacterium]
HVAKRTVVIPRIFGAGCVLWHERPEAMEESSVIMVGLNPERIMQGLLVLESQKRDNKRTLRQVADYSMPNVAEKGIRIIISYTDYINRVVWQKRTNYC